MQFINHSAMTSNKKRQRITESMSLLDEETETMSSNTHLHLYVLKWIHIIPVVEREEGEDCVVYPQTTCLSVLPLTLEQAGSIKRMIQSNNPNRLHFWESIGYTSVPLFGKQTLRIGEEDITVHETNVLLSCCIRFRLSTPALLTETPVGHTRHSIA